MILACDPGLSGAFALFDGEKMAVFDMPTFKRHMAHSDRRFLDEREAIALVRNSGAKRFVIEKVNGAPGQSAPAAFTFGYGVGLLTAAAIVENMEIERVEPALWKRALRVPSDKRASRARASELMPAWASKWPLAKHDGRAEAAMIALYAHRYIR